MKKLTQKFWMWIAGIVVLGMVAIAGFSQGVFFQGNLSLTPVQNGLTQRDLTQYTTLQVMPTSNQLRSGANSLFKVVVKTPK